MRRVTAAAGSTLFLGAAPGVVAGVVPWWLTGWHAGYGSPRSAPAVAATIAGTALVAAAGAVLVPAFARFVREGAGTPAPVAPTEVLVVGGLYRHVRNPMYVAVVAAIAGQALVLGRPVLVAYGTAAGAVMAAFARWIEEPSLLSRYGPAYDAYRQAVPGWLPRRVSPAGWRRGSASPGGR